MNFMEAVKAMKEGKKVRRKGWDDKSGAWTKQDDYLKSLLGMPSLMFENFEATDWEIVEDKKERPKNILRIPIKDRTEEEHQNAIEWFHSGSVREYLLSMGEFKDIPIVEDKKTLSDKANKDYVFPDKDKQWTYDEDAVKQFIKDIKEDIDKEFVREVSEDIDKIINKRAGERLI